MTDKEKIKAEIERLRQNLPWGGSAAQLSFECNCKNEAYTEIEKFINALPEEPVSEDLEEAAVEAFKQIVDSDKNNFLEIFNAGAEWQHKQLEKNRLTACDRQTKEEAEREMDFVIGIIDNEHRQPTFNDAINYGAKWQKERFIKKACEWLEKNDSYAVPIDVKIERFKQAMEEEV